MVKYTLWDTEVDIQIPYKPFPSVATIKDMDSLFPSSLKHGYFLTKSTGCLLHYRVCLPEQNLKGILVFQHGISAHSGTAFKLSSGQVTNYALLAHSMVKAGYGVYLLDMYGHGFSEGIRFYIPKTWEVNRDDLLSFAVFAASQHASDMPLFLGGDSYGGTLAIHVGRKFQDDPKNSPKGFRGLCLTAPGIIGDLPPAPVVFLLRRVLKPLAPTWIPFFMPNPIDPNRIWSDPEVKEMQTSSSVRQAGLQASGCPFRLGTAVALLSAMETVRENSIPGLNIPFCVAHGENDGGVPIEGTEKVLLAKSSTIEEDKSFLKMPCRHDLMAEPEAQQIINWIVDWMETRVLMQPVLL